jgi:uncharacterized membrane protein
VLVFFVGHMAGRINVDTVIELVSRDVSDAIRRLTDSDSPPPVPAPTFFEAVVAIADPRHGYVQELDADQLADWAAAHDCTIQLVVRPGDYVFPGAAIALAEPARDGIDRAIRRATALGGQRVSRIDLEFAVRQLVEIAVRALSPGINDPHTAMSVLDRLGAALCALVPRHLPHGMIERGDRTVLVVPVVDYDGLADAMFHLIRQNAAGSATVLIRMLEVLTAVAGVERRLERLAVLRRHADLVLGDGERDVSTPADLDDLRGRHRRFVAMQTVGPISMAEREAA